MTYQKAFSNLFSKMNDIYAQELVVNFSIKRVFVCSYVSIRSLLSSSKVGIAIVKYDVITIFPVLLLLLLKVTSQ